jgi:CPA2 family monovalent cation:H+ antiporter-2
MPTDPPHQLSLVFIELGAAVIVLAVLARVASRFGFSTIPLYLLAGLAFGNGGIVPLRFTEGIVHVGSEIGVLLLLFMLGLEYTGSQLGASLRSGITAGVVDFLCNFTPGLAAGILMQWEPMPAVLLGGVTWISSSGVVARVIAELRRQNFPETPTVLSILIIEDLAMAVYLPLVSVLLVGQGLKAGLVSVSVAVAIVTGVLAVAVRCGPAISRVLAHQSDEVMLFSTFGLVLLVAGIAQQFQVSAAIGAFLVGIALSGPIVKQTERMVGPLRDLFAAIFFLFFGLQIDPKTLPPVLPAALLLALVAAGTKIFSGWWAARRAGVDPKGCLRAGAVLTARGEFSIVIAGLGVSAEPRLGPLSAAFVLILAVVGPMLARAADPPLKTFGSSLPKP